MFIQQVYSGFGFLRTTIDLPPREKVRPSGLKKESRSQFRRFLSSVLSFKSLNRSALLLVSNCLTVNFSRISHSAEYLVFWRRLFVFFLAEALDADLFLLATLDLLVDALDVFLACFFLLEALDSPRLDLLATDFLVDAFFFLDSCTSSSASEPSSGPEVSSAFPSWASPCAKKGGREKESTSKPECKPMEQNELSESQDKEKKKKKKQLQQL
jgi:hypothetical protein